MIESIKIEMKDGKESLMVNIQLCRGRLSWHEVFKNDQIDKSMSGKAGHYCPFSPKN